jgi:hypothetical protein
MSRRRTLVALAALVSTVATGARSQSVDGATVLTTPQFVFYSDFATNLNDALIAAGNARRARQLELFASGDEKECFDGLPVAERAAWSSAVDYYAAVISPVDGFGRERIALRIELSKGNADWAEGEEARFLEVARGFRAGAAGAYRACRWTAQDAQNRRWIHSVAALLDRHAATLAANLPRLYATSWQLLPMRTDVVETVSWAGADSINLREGGAHILVGSGVTWNHDGAALEIVFHEASHNLTRPGAPLPSALSSAAAKLEARIPRDLWHAVLFYTTGETLRGVLADAGEPPYTPLIYTLNLFADNGVRAAIERTWPAYLAGERTLEVTAADLVRALAAPGNAD